MPKFRFGFERTYSITEGFDRVIEAPSYDEARAAAANLAVEFNDDCPDDCSEIESGDTEIGDFHADNYRSEEPVRVTKAPADYSIGLEGQCVPCGE